MSFLSGGSDVDEEPEPTDEEVRDKALKRELKVRQSRERFLARQATLGPIQLQAPTLGGI